MTGLRDDADSVIERDSIRLSARDFLLPSNSGLSDLLKENSAGTLFRNFHLFCNYALQHGWIRTRYGLAIEGWIERAESRFEDDAFKMTMSPVFRGWYSQFGKINDFSIEAPRLVELFDQWNNSTIAMNTASFAEEFSVIAGSVWFNDMDIVLKGLSQDRVLIRKDAECLTALEVESERLIGTIGLDGQSTHDTNGNRAIDGGLFAAPPRLWLPRSKVAVRNDVPTLCLGFTGSLDRETAIADELDLSEASYRSDFSVEEFAQAAGLILEFWPEQYRDLTTLVDVIIPREVPKGWRARGMTVSSYQGAIWLMARGVIPLFENIIHELSHVKLRYIEELLPILESDQTSDRFKIGWRTDRRPIVGVFEGVYVHTQMMLGLIKLREDRTGANEAAISTRLDVLEHEVRDGLAILRKEGRFTNAGEEFLDWGYETLENCHAG